MVTYLSLYKQQNNLLFYFGLLCKERKIKTHHSIWLLYGVKLATIWCQVGYYMVSRWLLYGVKLATIWYRGWLLYSVNMATIEYNKVMIWFTIGVVCQSIQWNTVTQK